jgi:terminase small subunit / prophage DNA-packing protein
MERDLRNLEETARFFDVSKPTVTDWIAKGCPVEQKGGNGVAYELCLQDVKAWLDDQRGIAEQAAADRARRDAQLKLQLLGDDNLAGEDAGLSARATADIYLAEVNRMKLAQMRRELVPADDVQFRLAQILTELKNNLRAMPDQLGKDLGLDDRTIDRMIELVDDYLTDTADAIEKILSEPAPALN